MSTDVLLMLCLIAAALVVFALELLPIEVTALAMLGVLLGTGLITIDQAIMGFSNKAVVAIGSLFILSDALVRTHALELGADHLSRRVGENKWLGIGIVLLSSGLLSGFLNNTAVVAIFIPLCVNLCKRFQISPSHVLMPLSFISILGGLMTVIGTSTSLLVSSLAEAAGQPALSMFEFTSLGLICLALGLIYVFLFARRMLPPRASVSSLTSKYEMTQFLTEVRVLENSRVLGRTPKEIQIGVEYRITVLAIVRDGVRQVQGIGAERLREGDTLIVEGTMDAVMRFRQEQRVALLPDIKLDDSVLSRGGQLVVEALVPAASALIGKTLKEIDFRQHYGAFVMAIRRAGATLHDRLAAISLKESDSLLMIVTAQRLRELATNQDLLIISELELKLSRRPLWWTSLIILPVVVLLAALGVVDILKGALLGAILTLILGLLKPQEAYRSISWPVLFLIAAFVPVGEAMVTTGTDKFIASGILSLSDLFPADLRPMATLGLIYLVTSILTQMVSNNASAIILTPVSLSLAASLGVDPRPYIIALCFAASAAFMTPMGYQTHMMIYGPGSYRFSDFTKFGTALNIGLWLIVTMLIPLFWAF